MASKNGDDVFKNVSDKISKGISLSKDDIISLSFSPIMGVEGLENYIVTERKGQLLVCRMSEEQRIKEFSASKK